MRAIESKKFREQGEQAAEILRLNPNLHAESREALEVRKRQSEVHRMIESRADIKLTVVEEGAPPNAAAFVEHSAINGKLRQAYIVNGVLGNPDHALHAAKHEEMHIVSGFTAIELRKELNDDQLRILQQRLGIQNEDETFWLEGFNELATIEDSGRDPNCGYNDEEVPAAQKLETLCMESTGVSLLATYKMGDKQRFYDRLRMLCDALLIEELRGMLMKNAA